MKTIKTITMGAMLIALMSVTTAVKAQWSLTGNSTTAPNNVLGTTNATDLDIRTGNTTRMFIRNSNGFVGIGTATPGYILDIVNSANATMSFRSTAGNALILVDRGLASGTASVNYRTGGVANWQTGNLLNNDFTINNVGSTPPSITILKTNNNVGIGTITPAYKLDVTGTGRFTSTLKVGAYTLPATDGTSGQVLKTNGTGTLTWTGDNNSGGTVTGITAGTGLSGGTITTSGTISAQNTTALWNANQLQGKAVLATVPALNQILKYDGTNWAPGTDNNSGGTVTSIATGTGLTGGPITTTGTVSLANSGVVAGAYGSGTDVPIITVDATGRITSASTVATSSANLNLSNLSTTSINQSLIPSINNTSNLGSSTLGWKDIYAAGSIYLDNIKFIDHSGTGNTAIGNDALKLNTTGTNNTANGFNALFSNTIGDDNTANGFKALFSNVSGSQNTATGFQALYSDTSGIYNTANGWEALYNTTSGNFNTSNGALSLFNNTTGDFNTATGSFALNHGTTGSDNTATGYHALYNNISGSYNTATGNWALFDNTTGYYNTANGYWALLNTTGYSNTANGYRAGDKNTTGNNNTFIGDSTDASVNNLNNATAIGSHAFVASSNSMVLGSINGVNGATSSVNVGIGIASPTSPLTIAHEAIYTFPNPGSTAKGAINIRATTNDRQTGITFSNFSGDNAQAGIYVSQVNATGTKMFLATTDNYTTGPQTRITIAENGNVGIGTTAPAFQLQLSTNSAAKPTSSAWTVASDARLKTNVKNFDDGMNVIEKLHPVWFSYNGKAGMPTNERGVGTLAQELKEIAPYMVNEWTYKNDKGEDEKYLGVDYGAMDFVLANAIKSLNGEFKIKNEELEKENANQQLAIGNLQNENQQSKTANEEKQHQIDALNKKLDDVLNQMKGFETSLSACCTDMKQGASTTQLPNHPITQLPVLEQNVPNPFTQSSYIKFYIPSSAKSAMIIVHDAHGRMMKQFSNLAAGFGTVTVEGGTLAAGTYNYSLMIDGNKMGTKEMVLTK